jgi:hypothetical protein
MLYNLSTNPKCTVVSHSAYHMTGVVINRLLSRFINNFTLILTTPSVSLCCSLLPESPRTPIHHLHCHRCHQRDCIFKHIEEIFVFFIRSLHDVHKMNAYRAVLVCLSIRVTDLKQIWYGHYAVGEYPLLYSFTE